MGRILESGYHTGITRVHHFIPKEISSCWRNFENASKYKYESMLKELVIASLPRASIRNRFMPEYAKKTCGNAVGNIVCSTHV